MTSRRSRSSYVGVHASNVVPSPRRSASTSSGGTGGDGADDDIESGSYDLNSHSTSGGVASNGVRLSIGKATSGGSLPPTLTRPTLGGPGFGLWRAIAGELNKLSTLQKETADTYRSAINENRLSGVLAVYDIDTPARLVNDYLGMIEKEMRQKMDDKDASAVAKKKQHKKKLDDDMDESDDGIEDLTKLSQRDAEALRKAYTDNKTRLAKEKKTLETIIESLKKLIPDSALAAVMAANNNENSVSTISNGSGDSVSASKESGPTTADIPTKVDDFKPTDIDAFDKDLDEEFEDLFGDALPPSGKETLSGPTSGLGHRKRRLDSDGTESTKPFSSTVKRSKLLGTGISTSGKSNPVSMSSSTSPSKLNSGTTSTAASATATTTHRSMSGSPSPPLPGSTSPYSFAATNTDSYMAVLFSGFPTSSLPIGAQVAFRLPKTRLNAEEEWIQCEVTKIYNDGTRYEVRDPEPDENGNPGQSYKATPKDLLPIATLPQQIVKLPPYPIGAQVLARYPETTTFYRAEVMGTKRDKCRLKFEGEEEENKEQEVERRLVLPIRNSK